MKTKTYKEKVPTKPLVYISFSIILLMAGLGVILYSINEKNIALIICSIAITGIFTWILIDGIRIFKNPKVLIDITDYGIEYLCEKTYKKFSWEEIDKIWIIQKSFRGNMDYKLIIKVSDGNDENIIIELIPLGRTTEFGEIYKNISNNLKEIDKQKEDIEVDHFIDTWLIGEGKEKDTGFRRAAIKDELYTEENEVSC